MQCIRGRLAKLHPTLSETRSDTVAEDQVPVNLVIAPLILQFEHDTRAISMLTSLVGKSHTVMTAFNRLGMCKKEDHRERR